MTLYEAILAKASGWAIITPEDHWITNIPFVEADDEPSLEVMQKAVGGYIEYVRLPDIHIIVHDEDQERSVTTQADALVNEEGKLEGLLPNPLATMWYANPYDVIVGNMIVMFGKARMK